MKVNEDASSSDVSTALDNTRAMRSLFSPRYESPTDPELTVAANEKELEKMFGVQSSPADIWNQNRYVNVVLESPKFEEVASFEKEQKDRPATTHMQPSYLLKNLTGRHYVPLA